MTINKQNVKMHNRQRLLQAEHNAHSVSFVLAIVLILYTVLYFYIKSILQDASVERYQSYFSLSVNFILFCSLFWKLFLCGKHMEKHLKNSVLVSLIVELIVYIITSSGLEKLLGLGIILMSIAVFQIDPLTRNERNVVYGLFVFAVVLILLNGTTELDSPDKSKFNPNGCGFLLAMVFCISLLRFFQAKKIINFLFVLGSFIMQSFFMSRTAMLGCLLFFILFILLKRKKKELTYKTIFLLLIAIPLLGIVIAFLYTEVLFPLIGVGKITIFGKDLFTGRQEIWHYTFLSIKQYFWFGVGSRLNQDLLQAGFYDLIINAHNQSLGTLAAFGIFFFAVFSIAFAQVGAFTYKSKHKGHTFTITPILFLAVICVMSWFDLYWFSQYNWVPFMICYSLICGFSKKETEIL